MPDLLTGIFRDQIHVLVPAITTSSLTDDISTEFDLNRSKGIDPLVLLMSQAIQPALGGIKPTPVKLLIEIPGTMSPNDVTKILTDVCEVKNKAGDNVIIIVALTGANSINNLSPGMKFSFELVS